jgi:hypothetical protein
MMLTWGALLQDQRRHSLRSAWTLGVAAGLACSAKFAGAMLLPLALTAPWVSPAGQRLQRSARVFGAALLVIVLINAHPAWLERDWTTRFEQEVHFVTHGHEGRTRPLPHDYYLHTTLHYLGWPWLVVSGIGLSFVLAQRRLDHLVREDAEPRSPHPRQRPIAVGPTSSEHPCSTPGCSRGVDQRSGVWVARAFLLVALTYAVVLSWLPKTAEPYFFPVMLAMCAANAIVISTTIRWTWRILPLPAPARWLAVASVLAAWLALLLPQPLQHLKRAWDDLAHDDRAELVEYLRTSVPSSETIVHDASVQLPGLANWRTAGLPREALLPHSTLSDVFAADIGSLAELRARGIRYIAVARPDYYHYTEGIYQARSNDTRQQAYQAFYQELFHHGELVWERPPGFVFHIRPGLRLYRLPD